MSLTVKNLSVSLKGKKLLQNINLEIKAGKIHALMGPNGSGKTTLAQAIMGNPNYQFSITNNQLTIDSKHIGRLKPDERARLGLFLAFQNPVAISGVTVANLLRVAAYQIVKSKSKESRRKVGIHDAVNALPIKSGSQTASGHNPALSVWEFNEKLVILAKKLGIAQELLRRSLNEDFSGGEKKKMEMLQALILRPKYAIFDEIDTGLDVDALKIVAGGINQLKKQRTGILIITHYQRILKYAKADEVYIMVSGKIVEKGDYKLAEKIEREGYKRWL